MNQNPKKLIEFYRVNKRMPSYSELALLYEFKSKNSAYSLANKFIELGVANKDASGNLTPGIHCYGIEVLGSVQAGFPTFASEERGEFLSLDEWLVGDPDATFLLKVSGDSMINAGIIEGDYVVIERTRKYSPGDIVIAEVDNEWTMKYLAQKDSIYYLKSANDEFPDIYPDGELVIHAVVKSLVRKYGK